LVERIVAGDADASTELYQKLRTFQVFFSRRLGSQEAEDHYHDLIIAIIQAIQRGNLRDPERLLGFARTIAVRMSAMRVGCLCAERANGAAGDPELLFDAAPNPESLAIRVENAEIATRILAAISWRDREVLVRFYLHEQDPERIQAEMGITSTQFRLIKSRAKHRFTQLVQRRIGVRSEVRRPSSTAHLAGC
jgi:DNA-directed RNA polymerase specialized sigma24 family protein